MLKKTVQTETTTTELDRYKSSKIKWQTGQPFTASLWLLRNQSTGQGTNNDMKKMQCTTK
jgi:hypothetical protein